MADMKKWGAVLVAQFHGLHGLHPSRWPMAPRMLCGLGTLLAVVAFGRIFYLAGQWEEQDLGAREENTLKEAYKVKLQQAVNLEGLRKQKNQVGFYVATLEKQLPSKAEMDALLSDINQAGLGRGLQFELFKPRQVVVKDYYAELPIDIKVVGNYHDIGAFTSDIANLPRIVTINNMSLTAGKDGMLVLDAVIKTFRYLDASEVMQQRKTVAGRKETRK